LHGDHFTRIDALDADACAEFNASDLLEADLDVVSVTPQPLAIADREQTACTQAKTGQYHHAKHNGLKSRERTRHGKTLPNVTGGAHPPTYYTALKRLRSARTIWRKFRAKQASSN